MTQDSRTEELLVASTATIASGLSVGYVVWLARGGLLAASLLSSMPAWRLIDPLPVLAYADGGDEPEQGESLVELIGAAGEAQAPAADTAADDVERRG